MTTLRRGLPPTTVYLILEFCVALFFSLIFTVNMIYQVTVVGLTPFQLVLVGTILETTAFLFEIPTGVVADVKSRRLSVIVGYLLTGVAFVVEGSLPFFAAVAISQVLWGIGYTFTSGATQAWIADEVGEERAGQVFMQGSQAGRVGGLLAIPVSVAVGSLDVRLPIVLGGLLFLGLAGFLALAMREEGFRPTPPGERSTWAAMLDTLQDARRLTRRQPVVLALLGIGLFYGLYSEGLDRLWTPHLLEGFAPPFGGALEPVVWLGALRGVVEVAGLAALEVARRRYPSGTRGAARLATATPLRLATATPLPLATATPLPLATATPLPLATATPLPLARVLMVSAALIVAGVAVFGLARSLWLAVAALLLVSTLRSLTGPLHTAWLNHHIDDPQVRATLFSATGQVDALGQIGGGPLVGAIGNVSIRAALVASSLLLLPVLPLYRLARRRSVT